MRASGKSNEDLNYDFHQIHQLKHPKGLDFGFEHCWHILREVLIWEELHNNSMKTPKSLKRKMFANALDASKDSTMESEVVEHSSRKAPTSHGASPNQENWRPPSKENKGGFGAWQI